MIGTIRNCNISTKGGILAAFLFAAAFASAQVACLTHGHCIGEGCFDCHEESHDPHGHEHRHDHDAHQECDYDRGNSCEDVHQDHDIHHHLHDGKTHPQRRFTAPVHEVPFAGITGGDTPVIEAATWLPEADGPSPLERYGLIFAGRAPPHA